MQALFNNQEFGIIENKILDTSFDGLDGPYLINSVAYFVNQSGHLSKSLPVENEIKVITGKGYLRDFKVRLKSPEVAENAIYPDSDKVLAISDIEGNFTGFFSFLLSNKVIDNKGNWIYGLVT